MPANKNGWMLLEYPAGDIEQGETVRRAAERELFEETHQENIAFIRYVDECDLKILELSTESL